MCVLECPLKVELLESFDSLDGNIPVLFAYACSEMVVAVGKHLS